MSLKPNSISQSEESPHPAPIDEPPMITRAPSTNVSSPAHSDWHHLLPTEVIEQLETHSKQELDSSED